MTKQGIPYAVEIRISNRNELEDQLDRAVEGAIRVANDTPGHGVLVTRHDHKTFTVELSHEVPHGTISELVLYP